MLFTELKEISFEKEKEGCIEIKLDDFTHLFELDFHVLKSTGEPLDGKYYLHDIEEIHYYKNGKYHRDDNLPAVIYKSGSLLYMVNGIYHRLDGPAIIYFDGDYSWYINGHEINVEEEMNNWLNENNIPIDWNLWTESDKFYFALHWSDYNGEE